jgi:hypothetical protein
MVGFDGDRVFFTRIFCVSTTDTASSRADYNSNDFTDCAHWFINYNTNSFTDSHLNNSHKFISHNSTTTYCCKFFTATNHNANSNFCSTCNHSDPNKHDKTYFFYSRSPSKSCQTINRFVGSYAATTTATSSI